jgi:hypothetical protein
MLLRSCAVNFYNAGVVNRSRRIGSWVRNFVPRYESVLLRFHDIYVNFHTQVQKYICTYLYGYVQIFQPGNKKSYLGMTLPNWVQNTFEQRSSDVKVCCWFRSLRWSHETGLVCCNISLVKKWQVIDFVGFLMQCAPIDRADEKKTSPLQMTTKWQTNKKRF